MKLGGTGARPVYQTRAGYGIRHRIICSAAIIVPALPAPRCPPPGIAAMPQTAVNVNHALATTTRAKAARSSVEVAAFMAERTEATERPPRSRLVALGRRQHGLIGRARMVLRDEGAEQRPEVQHLGPPGVAFEEIVLLEGVGGPFVELVRTLQAVEHEVPPAAARRDDLERILPAEEMLSQIELVKED